CGETCRPASGSRRSFGWRRLATPAHSTSSSASSSAAVPASTARAMPPPRRVSWSPPRSPVRPRRRDAPVRSGDPRTPCRGTRAGAIRRSMERLPAVEPMPPTASIVLPWDAPARGPSDPVLALAGARARHGDTFVVDSGGIRYLFLFSAAGVRAFYALPERQASKGLADCRMLLRKLPEELFLGRRTFAHDLFSNEEVEGYLGHLDGAIERQLDELGDAGTLEVFAWTRRLGHRLGLASWAGDESAAAPRLAALIADLDRLDGSEAFVRPSAMASI